VFERLRRVGAKICMFGLPLEEATFRHHVEEVAEVPFRFRKLFTGTIREGGRTRRAGWLYSVRILAENGQPDGRRLEERARSDGVCRAAPLRAGELLAVEARSYFDLARGMLRTDPWYTAKGPPGNPVGLEAARVGGKRPSVRLGPDASMEDMVAALWHLPRDIVSDGYDAALAALGTVIPMAVHEFPSGLECWTWIVPEKWTCREAYLERLDGTRLFAYADNPLHVVSYSLPFEGEVTRETLLAHLHVHPRLQDAVPFVFKYYERDWGLCCSQTVRDGLTDARYRVVIRTDFSFGTLKVGEVVVPGRSEETIVLCAHLCHPGMVNDDLTGVAVGIDVARRLLAGPAPRYTYRLLIVPETIGSIAYLGHHPERIRRMRGGLFLEMLGRAHPHALQLSFEGTTEVDRCFAQALRDHDPGGWTTPFRTLAGNDERQFNAPGVRVPMLALTRQLPPSDPESPYREYHSSEDTPDRVPEGCLAESRDLVLHMLGMLERDIVPVNRFQGEIFCSRYGIHIDPYINPQGSRALFDIMFLIDGTRSVAEIASTCKVSMEAVEGVLRELQRHGLVDLGSEERSVPT
jgi:aminopeptidase-like protein